MNAKQFFDEVSKMRSLQREYYKTRSSIVLRDAKEQEQLIDKEINRVNSLLESKNEMQNLFEK